MPDILEEFDDLGNGFGEQTHEEIGIADDELFESSGPLLDLRNVFFDAVEREIAGEYFCCDKDPNAERTRDGERTDETIDKANGLANGTEPLGNSRHLADRLHHAAHATGTTVDIFAERFLPNGIGRIEFRTFFTIADGRRRFFRAVFLFDFASFGFDGFGLRAAVAQVGLLAIATVARRRIAECIIFAPFEAENVAQIEGPFLERPYTAGTAPLGIYFGNNRKRGRRSNGKPYADIARKPLRTAHEFAFQRRIGFCHGFGFTFDAQSRLSQEEIGFNSDIRRDRSRKAEPTRNLHIHFEFGESAFRERIESAGLERGTSRYEERLHID